MVSSRLLAAVCAALLVTASAQPAQAAGDAAAGEKVFKKCAVCHSLDPARRKLGPTLRGVVGRAAGSVEGYKYSSSYVEAGGKGLVWTEAEIVEYLANPKKYLAAYLGIKRAKSRMTARFSKLADRENVVAYLREAAE